MAQTSHATTKPTNQKQIIALCRWISPRRTIRTRDITILRLNLTRIERSRTKVGCLNLNSCTSFSGYTLTKCLSRFCIRFKLFTTNDTELTIALLNKIHKIICCSLTAEP